MFTAIVVFALVVVLGVAIFFRSKAVGHDWVPTAPGPQAWRGDHLRERTRRRNQMIAGSLKEENGLGWPATELKTLARRRAES